MTHEIPIVYRSPKGNGLAKATTEERPPEAAWTFLTNHSHVLLCLVQDRGARMRDVAEKVGITERAVQRIVSELEAMDRWRDVEKEWDCQLVADQREEELAAGQDGRQLLLDLVGTHPYEAFQSLEPLSEALETALPILQASDLLGHRDRHRLRVAPGVRGEAAGDHRPSSLRPFSRYRSAAANPPPEQSSCGPVRPRPVAPAG